jgi:DNA (cytosine-5)-methyltransferase 1
MTGEIIDLFSGPRGESEARNPDWPFERPATTVAGDPRIAQPGHKNDEANPDAPGRTEGAIRVTTEEAAILQSFPPAYPWLGTRSKVFEQIGNAVPPLMAFAILREVADAASLTVEQTERAA